MTLELPAALTREWAREAAWLADLPRLAAECAERWGLRLEEPFETPYSLVVPAGELVLKLNAPTHFEADHEADALALWGGVGAVELVARDDERRALLVERCRPGTRLGESVADGVEVVTGLLSRLAHTVGESHPFHLLTDEAERWLAEVPARYERAGAPFERSLLDAACATFADVDPDARVLVNQDLHPDNILRATREPWLVIDPKPLVGERELNAVGLLRNVEGAPAAVRRWLDGLAEIGLDRGRMRGWGLAHALAWGTDSEGRWSDWSIEIARTISRA